VAMVVIDLLDMAVLRLTLAPFQHHSLVRQEHGRTIPLRDIPQTHWSPIKATSPAGPRSLRTLGKKRIE
jgi:hypothetical protein